MSSCEKKLNGYVNLKRTVGYQSTIIGEFACYILACLSSCLITEWLQLPHEATSSCHRVSVYCTVSCFAGSVFTSMTLTQYNANVDAQNSFRPILCTCISVTIDAMFNVDGDTNSDVKCEQSKESTQNANVLCEQTFNVCWTSILLKTVKSFDVMPLLCVGCVSDKQTK